MQRHRMLIATVLVFAANVVIAGAPGSPPASFGTPAAEVAPAPERAPAKRGQRGPVEHCLPGEAGAPVRGRPDYADTRRVLAERARQGATAAERAHAAAMLARIDAEEAGMARPAAELAAPPAATGDTQQTTRQPAVGAGCR